MGTVKLLRSPHLAHSRGFLNVYFLRWTSSANIKNCVYFEIVYCLYLQWWCILLALSYRVANEYLYQSSQYQETIIGKRISTENESYDVINLYKHWSNNDVSSILILVSRINEKLLYVDERKLPNNKIKH